jgi:putative redox protein
MRDVSVRTVAPDGLVTEAAVGPHRIRFDEPVSTPGGTDAGPAPTEILLAALGACEAITLRMYAARKGWALRDVAVHLSGATVNGVFVIRRRLELQGDLDQAQRTRLHEIACRCPVHRILDNEVRVDDVIDVGAAG